MKREVINGTWHPEASSEKLAISPAANFGIAVCRGGISVINSNIMRGRNFHSPRLALDLRDWTTVLASFDDNTQQVDRATSRTIENIDCVMHRELLKVALDRLPICSFAGAPWASSWKSLGWIRQGFLLNC